MNFEINSEVLQAVLDEFHSDMAFSRFNEIDTIPFKIPSTEKERTSNVLQS